MATKLLEHFPKPVLDDLVNGRWLPVIGAGMSLNATVRGSKKRMPLWNDMAKSLADELPDFTSNGVLDSISHYEHEFGRTRLIERLSEILLLKDAQPGEAHKEFCSIPFDIVCTTNFDFLLERQYDLTPHYVYPVVEEGQLAINISGPGTLLLKLHGDLRHPSHLIVTESDYDGFLSTYPLIATYLANQLITKTAVFIGYSLDDPDFRQIWHVVSDRLGRTRRLAYTIMVGARQADVSRFERRGVKVINLPGSRNNYGRVLASAFVELREYMRENVISVSKVTEERPLRELLLPRDSTTRLCFFSLPLELLPFYRERVFPAVEDAGFVPITADDVVSPGDNLNAKIDTLIDRAWVMIVDLSSQWTRAEYHMALARIRDSEKFQSRRQQFHLIVIAATYQPADEINVMVGDPLYRNAEVLYRPELIDEDIETFVSQLVEILKAIYTERGDADLNEAKRLLEAGEYRAAVISAMTTLETGIRERLGKKPRLEVGRPMTLRALLSVATNQQLLHERDTTRINTWIRIRNEAVHSSKLINKTDAREIVNGVAEILNRPL